MSGWNGARSLAAGTSQLSRYLKVESQSLARRLGSRQIHVATSASAPYQCRRYDRADLELKRGQIRAKIRMLEFGRRRFTTTPQQMHGHIDPPKPGEEYVMQSPDFIAEMRMSSDCLSIGCISRSLTKTAIGMNSKCPREIICWISPRRMTWKWRVSLREHICPKFQGYQRSNSVLSLFRCLRRLLRLLNVPCDR